MTVPLFLGAVFSFVNSGIGRDWMAGLLSRRNGGVQEPEHRLVNFVFPDVISFVGLLWFGDIGGHRKLSLDSLVRIEHFSRLRLPGHQFCSFRFCDRMLFKHGRVCSELFNRPSLSRLIESSTVPVMASAGRIVSFGISFGVYGLIDLQGYFGTFGILADVVADLGLRVIPSWSKLVVLR